MFDDADWDFTSFDYDADLRFALEKVGEDVDADDPDLRPMRDKGAKLIVYHGWSDPDISPVASLDYYGKVVDTVAGDMPGASREAALESTRDFFRLFMVPGMGHCRGGPGPDRFDALGALENWVERGIAPGQIIARKIESGGEARSRPLCPHPEVAVYNGSGSTDQAQNFSCRVPD